MSNAQPLQHEGTQVDIYIARLIPPWFNVSIPIHGQGRKIVAPMWLLGRRKLRRTLQAAGFEVVEHVTWTYRGFHWNDVEGEAA